MFNRTLRATALLTLVIAVAAPVAVAAPDPSSPPEPETVTVSSLKGDGRMDYWGEFKVDCLTTGGPTATVTGRLVRTSPGHPWLTTLDRTPAWA